MDIMEEEIVQGDNFTGQEYYTDDMQQVEIEQQHEADLGLDLQLSGDEGKIIFSSCLVFPRFLFRLITWIYPVGMETSPVLLHSQMIVLSFVL